MKSITPGIMMKNFPKRLNQFHRRANRILRVNKISLSHFHEMTGSKHQLFVIRSNLKVFQNFLSNLYIVVFFS